MKTLFSYFFIFLISLGNLLAQDTYLETEDHVKATDRNMKLLIQALAEENAENAASFFNNDALMLFMGQPLMGKESISIAFKEAFEKGLKFRLYQNKKLFTEDGVYEVGTAEILQNNQIYDQGLYEVQWKKEDGRWRISRWEGPIKEENTKTVAVQLQKKDIFPLENGVSVSNNFDGARLNGVTAINDSLTEILITPENTPINPSPWYAFKVWAPTKRDIHIKLSYTDPYLHRYYPKVSKDGINWKIVDSSQVKAIKWSRRERPFFLGFQCLQVLPEAQKNRSPNWSLFNSF